MIPASIVGPLAAPVRRLLAFTWTQTRACAFAFALLSGVAVSALLPELPVARYDVLVVYGVLLTLLFWARGWESGRDIAVIAACHGVGRAFELVKVALGSWSHPEPAVLKFAGVPLYGGFLYAAVGSCVCRAWHLFDLGLVRYRPRATAVVAAAMYVKLLQPPLAARRALGAGWTARGRHAGDVGLFHRAGSAPADAAGVGVRADRVLPVGGGESGNPGRRMALSVSAARLGAAGGGEVRGLGAPSSA